MARKNHFTTIHAQLGLAVFIGFISLGVFGGVVLHPGNFPFIIELNRAAVITYVLLNKCSRLGLV